MDKINILLEAISLAADKHKFQRRKGSLNIPYINHPIKVCNLIKMCGEDDIDLLISAILHDTIEDTITTQSELADLFGQKVASIVMEVTDDMKLPKKKRKELQIIEALTLSRQAKIIKVADKASNIEDILAYPIFWTKKRKIEYIEWSKLVFEGCKGENNTLDNYFLDIYRKGCDILRVYNK
jgi:GTP diphosphokinase / guanosine-3',5'-bis(diphosphate) 3'-diphosphatase